MMYVIFPAFNSGIAKLMTSWLSRKSRNLKEAIIGCLVVDFVFTLNKTQFLTTVF